MAFFRRSKGRPKNELRELLDGYELPSFPGVVTNVLSMLRDPDSSITDIADQLQVDPGMHVKVLKTVNAAAFGLVTRVTNLQHAAKLLGRSRLESIVLSHAVSNALPAVRIPSFEIKRFWATAAKRASLARLLAREIHPATEDESFTAGLLQDMAVAVIANAKRKDYVELLEHWDTDKTTWLHVLEREAFSYDHSDIGRLMAEEWKLPERLVVDISGHHGRNGGPNVDAAVKLVSYIREEDRSDGSGVLMKKCQEEFNIPEDKVLEMMDEAFEYSSEFAQMFQ